MNYAYNVILVKEFPYLLTGRVREAGGGTDKDSPSSGSLAKLLQQPSKGQAEGRDLELHLRLSQVARPKHFSRFPPLSQAQGAALEVEHPGLKPVLTEDSGVTGGSRNKNAFYFK